jgi:hypothetical protein
VLTIVSNFIIVITLVIDGTSYNVCLTFFEGVFCTRIFGIRSVTRSSVARSSVTRSSVTRSLSSIVPIIDTVALLLKFTDLMIESGADPS